MSTVNEAGVEAVAEVVGRFNAAWNAHDLAAAIALTSEDCVFEATSPGPGRRAQRGPRGDPRGLAADLRRRDEPLHRGGLVHGRLALVQRWRYDWAGGHVRGIDVFTVSGGKVTEKLAYVKG